MDQISTCNMKRVTCRDEPLENFPSTLHLPSPQSILASFGFLFWFYTHTALQRCFQQKVLKTDYMVPAQQAMKHRKS